MNLKNPKRMKNNLNQEKINKIFSLYKEVTNKPVVIPTLQEVKERLNKNLAYEYATKGFQWTSKLIFTKQGDKILIEFIYNERVPRFMIESLKLMKQEFDKKIKDYLN